MSKIYTVTFQRVLNYGAVLQAYALMKYLQNSGHDVSVLDYAPSYFMLQTLRPAKGIQKSIDKYNKYQKFKQFRDEFMTLTPNTYYSFKALNKLPTADAVICGSDQIWNYKLTANNFDPTFFLDFAKPNTKRIAFAASAGSIRINEHKNEVEHLLEKFDSIGTRETVLAEDIKQIKPGANPEVVVDPCLLIKDYSEVFDESRLPTGPFIVSYVVGSGEMLTQFNKRVEDLKKLVDLPIVHLGAKRIEAADINILDIGPSDWITFIAKADYVITNSFHGTAFSINFEKDFTFVPHVIENLNARQMTLLKSVNLESRLLNTSDEMTKETISNIDYKTTTKTLLNVVNKAKDFLSRAINGTA